MFYKWGLDLASDLALTKRVHHNFIVVTLPSFMCVEVVALTWKNSIFIPMAFVDRANSAGLVIALEH